jgi:hypothetical protein
MGQALDHDEPHRRRRASLAYSGCSWVLIQINMDGYVDAAH